MAVTVSARLQTVGRGRDREGLMPVSQACGSPPILGPGGPICLGNWVPPRTQMPRHMGPGHYLYIQASWSG